MALHRYSFWIFVAFLFGIALHSFWPEVRWPEMVWPIFGIIGAMGLVLSRARLCLAFLLLSTGCLGAFLFDLTIPRSSDGVFPFIGQTISIEGRVKDVGRATQSPDFVRVDSVNRKRIHGPGHVIAVRLPNNVKSATNVRFSCSLKTLSPNTWGRASYLRRSAWTSCSGVESLEVLPASAWDAMSLLTRWRELLTARIHRRFAPEDAGLLAGMLYGDEELSTEARNEFRDAGLIHLIAVSGANVTLVVSALMPVAFIFHATRRRAFLFASFGLLLFLGFVGASAAVVRAGMMGWLALLAREFGRLPRPEHLMVCAAVGLCLLNPRTLAFDVGFHLSMLATWGLLAWAEPLEKRLERLPKILGLRSALATSIAVTVALFPYALWMFGTYSLAGLLTNMIALPLVPWIMLFGAISVVVPDGMSEWVVLPVSGFLHLLQLLADLGARLPGMEARKGSSWILFATYALMFLADRHFRYPQSKVFGRLFSVLVGALRQRDSQKNIREHETISSDDSFMSDVADKNR